MEWFLGFVGAYFYVCYSIDCSPVALQGCEGPQTLGALNKLPYPCEWMHFIYEDFITWSCFILKCILWHVEYYLPFAGFLQLVPAKRIHPIYLRF